MKDEKEKSIYESKLFVVVCILVVLVIIGGMFIVFQMMLLASHKVNEFTEVPVKSSQEVVQVPETTDIDDKDTNVVEEKDTSVVEETNVEESEVEETGEEVRWKDDLYVIDSGNLGVASDILKDMKPSDIDIENTLHIEPSEVVRKPWDYYGDFITLKGYVAFVQAYPESSEWAKGFQTNGTVTEMTLVAEDGRTIISFFYKGDYSNVATDTLLSVTGLPCGLWEVGTRLGGSAESIVVVGINEPVVVVEQN